MYQFVKYTHALNN